MTRAAASLTAICGLLLFAAKTDELTGRDRDAVDTFLHAESAYRHGDYAGTSKLLDAFWLRHPAGTREWAEGIQSSTSFSRSTGMNFGSPIAYYGLRMLTECAAWRKKHVLHPPPPQPIQLTVLLVGHSSGVEPTTLQELHDNTGQMAHHDLDPALAGTGGREIIDQSLWLFLEYVRAITGGRLDPQVRVVQLRDLDIAVYTADGEHRMAEPAGSAMARIWQAVDDETRASTDWWWVLYPSHVPEQYPDFTHTEFVTGGMATGPDGVSPAFLIDDRWIIRKPPHLGHGPYSEDERRVYMPEWFQHEFFHHLYRTWPEFRLDVTGHQWFDRKTWPSDFQGLIEPDYYAESLHKRLETATPPLWVGLRYAAPSKAIFLKLTAASLTGSYRREPSTNDWHHGVITGDPLVWRNDAGKSWGLIPDFAHGVLLTGADNPYFNTDAGHVFQLVLRRGADGAYLPEVVGFRFNGDLYSRVK